MLKNNPKNQNESSNQQVIDQNHSSQNDNQVFVQNQDLKKIKFKNDQENKSYKPSKFLFNQRKKCQNCFKF